jgi:hypothetical protein
MPERQHRACRQHQRGSEQIGAVDLHGAHEKTAPRHMDAPIRRDIGIGRGGRIPAEKHEHFRCVTVGVVMQHETRQKTALNMIERDDNQHESAQKIDLK